MLELLRQRFGFANFIKELRGSRRPSINPAVRLQMVGMSSNGAVTQAASGLRQYNTKRCSINRIFISI